ncbi:hypothetical protein EP7_002579 [Isosphaeraceae bacterium EP7]
MKSLIVYKAGNDWFGQEVSWKRSGSGYYREISGMGIPQTRDEIEKFARENGYSVEWRESLEDIPAAEAATG